MGLKKQVLQFKDGKQIAVYNSAVEAANAVGSTRSNISKCCNNKLKQVKGFVFRYSGNVANKKEEKGKFKCPYCERKFESYNGLAKHVFGNNGHDEVSQEQLLTDFVYGGIRPTCKCGCGGYTDITYTNGAHFCDYIQGHQSRIHNNWGHNEKAKKNSAETRRKQYANGKRIQWNKGKSWKETYNEETIARLMTMYTNEERNRKISEKLVGVPKSEEHKRKDRESCRSPKNVEERRLRMHRLITSNKFSLTSKNEQRFINECVIPLGIDVITQYYLKEIRHYCDVYIPSKNTIIEFQGDYWHGNPKKYLKEELSPYQLDKIERDEIEREFCKNNGIRLIEVWESEFNKDKNGVFELLKRELL